jgi:hypothetical protein
MPKGFASVYQKSGHFVFAKEYADTKYLSRVAGLSKSCIDNHVHTPASIAMVNLLLQQLDATERVELLARVMQEEHFKWDAPHAEMQFGAHNWKIVVATREKRAAAAAAALQATMEDEPTDEEERDKD